MGRYSTLVVLPPSNAPTAVPASRFARALLATLVIAALGGCDLGDDDDDDDVANSGEGIEPGDAGDAGFHPAVPVMPGSEDDSGIDPDDAGPAHCVTDADCPDSDGLYCNGIPSCVNGECVPGTPKVCPLAHDCSEALRACDCTKPDSDGDGYKAQGCITDGVDGTDCNDMLGTIHPGVTEVCDPGDVDEDCDWTTFGDTDADGDGEVSDQCCNTKPDRTPNCGVDCNDREKATNTRAVDDCDERDNDCDHKVDEAPGSSGTLQWTFYYDGDGDTQGLHDVTMNACVKPPHYSTEDGDCNDEESTWFLGGTEICDGEDNDCDGMPDDNLTPPTVYRGEATCRGHDGWHISKCDLQNGLAMADDCNHKYEDGCETSLETLTNCRMCERHCDFSCGDADCDEIEALAAGEVNSCAITHDGAVACWGDNGGRQIGDDTSPTAATAHRVSVLDHAELLAVGAHHACASEGDEHKLYCWGDNSQGQLGNTNAMGGSPAPVQVGVAIGAQDGITSLAAGNWHTCAVIAGQALCWGRGDDGRVGDGDVSAHRVGLPSEVRRAATGNSLRDAKQIVAGDGHSCALTLGGTVECWGDNSNGQLGRGSAVLTNAGTSAPVTGLSDVEALAAGTAHTCALRQGVVYCWGANFYGQLGRTTVTAQDSLAGEVPDLPPVTAIAAGLEITCAIDRVGGLWCWGRSLHGELNVVNPTALFPPTKLAVDPVRVVVVGGGHVCALLVAGQVQCWGNNSSGQLGVGTTSPVEPLPLSLLPLYGSK